MKRYVRGTVAALATFTLMSGGILIATDTSIEELATAAHTYTTGRTNPASSLYRDSHSTLDADGVETLANGDTIRHEAPPTRDNIAAMQITATSDHTLRIPAAGIDTELKTLSLYHESGQPVLNPPTSDHPYLVRDYGTPNDPAHMTVIAMHSIRHAPHIPGSKLINIEHGTATVAPGDTVYVDDIKYTITKIHNEPKRQVASDGALWRDEPGKLLLFTCLQRASGHSFNNIVIEAHRNQQK